MSKCKCAAYPLRNIDPSIPETILMLPGCTICSPEIKEEDYSTYRKDRLNKKDEE